MTISYSQLNQQLKQAHIGLSSADLHGFLTGILCGGVQDQSWQPLLFQFTNDNHAYPISLLKTVTEIYQQIQSELADMESFAFKLWLNEEDNIFIQADSLAEWTNHFLLGLGLAQPYLDKEKGEIGEAIDDLQAICQLGYSEDENEEELAKALEEIVEYVKTIALLCYSHFQSNQSPQTLH